MLVTPTAGPFSGCDSKAGRSCTRPGEARAQRPRQSCTPAATSQNGQDGAAIFKAKAGSWLDKAKAGDVLDTVQLVKVCAAGAALLSALRIPAAVRQVVFKLRLQADFGEVRFAAPRP